MSLTAAGLAVRHDVDVDAVEKGLHARRHEVAVQRLLVHIGSNHMRRVSELASGDCDLGLLHRICYAHRGASGRLRAALAASTARTERLDANHSQAAVISRVASRYLAASEHRNGYCARRRCIPILVCWSLVLCASRASRAILGVMASILGVRHFVV